eukprot:GHVN01013343.1.p1 GENE.GHVN01013343.1~~GHVN01013343.1.p1  ORF type:complete len:291 (+),score=51.25 GHVN01013343.1:1047-1919(+)
MDGGPPYGGGSFAANGAPNAAPYGGSSYSGKRPLADSFNGPGPGPYDRYNAPPSYSGGYNSAPSGNYGGGYDMPVQGAPKRQRLDHHGQPMLDEGPMMMEPPRDYEQDYMGGGYGAPQSSDGYDQGGHGGGDYYGYGAPQPVGGGYGGVDDGTMGPPNDAPPLEGHNAYDPYYESSVPPPVASVGYYDDSSSGYGGPGGYGYLTEGDRGPSSTDRRAYPPRDPEPRRYGDEGEYASRPPPHDPPVGFDGYQGSGPPPNEHLYEGYSPPSEDRGGPPPHSVPPRNGGQLSW